eukprot:GFKZ01013890.1.p1 GENE.GFKZ01013890.1~~GFKZ01013890.1.p1  ORF type:complete len:344 (+),score=54.08 GFKZ01013890.1:93-1034(+)
MEWNPEDVPPLTNNTYIVTGTTSGTGLETARFLYRNGATVILASRNPDKLAHVTNQFVTEQPPSPTPGILHSLVVDTSDLESVRSFVEAFKNLGVTSVDALVLNAGVNRSEFERSAQGYEMDFATNHLGHWLMTGLLMPYLKAGGGGRVVSVSSLAHRMVNNGIDYHLARGNGDKFDMMEKYSQSKLANLLFMSELNRRLSEAGVAEVVAVGCHPGGTKSNLIEGQKLPLHLTLAKRVFGFFAQEAVGGAMPIVMAALDQTAKAGDYYGPSGFAEFSGKPKKNCVLADEAKDPDQMSKLWAVSEELTSFKYQF